LRGATGAEAGVGRLARPPVAGRAKTRLIPRLGAWRAAQLQRRLTQRAVETARASFPVELHATSRHCFFRRFAVTFRLQKGADLGERMHHALAAALRRHRAAILIGTDCPALTARDLRRAARLLCSHDVVLAPAEDGGYALIGMSKPRAGIFRNISWGEGSVLAETLSRIGESGLSCALLRTVWDVDRPEDLERLRSPRFSSAARRAARQ
jgi:rSAM/selenodomain-associated transferase 1